LNKVVDLDDIPEDNDLNLDKLPDVNPITTERIFTFGAVKMARIRAQKDSSPGSLLNENHDFEVYSKYYKENLLNYDSIITTAGSHIDFSGERKFIRPNKRYKIIYG
jgi:hypothetical protein